MSGRLRRRARDLEQWLDARSVRERAVLGLGVLAALAAAFVVLVLDPTSARRRELEAQAQTLEAEVAGLETQGREIIAAHQIDPNQALAERAEALRRQIEGLDESIRAHTVAMIPPPEMARFLEEMLAEHTDMRLVRLENLGAEPLLEGSASEGSASGSEASGPEAVRSGVFKHAFEVELEGRYLSTLRYLEALETLPWKFFWEALAYEVIEYPRGRATIRAYTLSADEEWIGV